MHAGAGQLAPCCTKHAKLQLSAEERPFLVVREMPSAALLHRWQIPDQDSYLGGHPRLHWAPDSGTLVVEYGAQPSAGLACPAEQALSADHAGGAWVGDGTAPEDDNAGLLFVELASGAQTAVDLPSQEVCVAADYFPRVHSWSSASLLLVQHDDDDGQDSFSVFDKQGTVLDRLDQFVESFLCDSYNVYLSHWSPSGTTVLLTEYKTATWLWDVQAYRARSLDRTVHARAFRPCSGWVVGTPGEQGLPLLDVSQGTVSWHQVPEGSDVVAWGHHGLVMHKSESGSSKGQPEWCTHLCVYKLSAGQLVLTLSAEVAHDPAQPQVSGYLSPDGRHCLLCSSLPVKELSTCPDDASQQQIHRLSVADCLTGHTRELPKEAFSCSPCVYWSYDSSRILIKDRPGDGNAILDFNER